MNSRDKSKENRPIPDSEWADLVERFVQDTTGDRVPTTDQILATKLKSAEVDDLELDGQLRMLGRMSNSRDPFVDSVMNAVDMNPNREPLNNSRLPVLTPAVDEPLVKCVVLTFGVSNGFTIAGSRTRLQCARRWGRQVTILLIDLRPFRRTRKMDRTAKA